MHDKLFANQHAALDPASLEGYARELGLDVPRFQADLASPLSAATIERDQELAGGLGLNGTPAIFINGRRLPGGAAPIESFKALIDEELAKAEAMVRAGTPPSDVYARIIAKEVRRPTRPPPGRKRERSAPPTVRTGRRPVPMARTLRPRRRQVTIVEWSDFQCPFCSQAVPTVEKLRQTYGKGVRFAFRGLPPAHAPQRPYRRPGRACCAGPGRFWLMHGRMFADQKALDRASLENIAEKLGLDMARFRADIDSPEVKARIEAPDMKAASEAGVHATPPSSSTGAPRRVHPSGSSSRPKSTRRLPRPTSCSPKG